MEIQRLMNRLKFPTGQNAQPQQHDWLPRLDLKWKFLLSSKMIEHEYDWEPL